MRAMRPIAAPSLPPHTSCVFGQTRWRSMGYPVARRGQRRAAHYSRSRAGQRGRPVGGGGGRWGHRIQHRRPAVRLVQGSHIVVRRLYTITSPATSFRTPTAGSSFSFHIERDFTLIGTTDQDFQGDPTGIRASVAEIEYLCRSTSEYLRVPVTPDMVVWTYSGVRGLYDDGSSAAQEATRDYVLKLDAPAERSAVTAVGLRGQDHDVSSTGGIRIDPAVAAPAAARRDARSRLDCTADFAGW